MAKNEIHHLDLNNIDISGIIFRKYNTFLEYLPYTLEYLIFYIKDLNYLFLQSNELEELPKNIGDIKNLTHLYIYNNKLKSD